MRIKITKQERDEGLAAFPMLLNLIELGKWDYSQSQLKREFASYSYITWFQVHPVWTLIFCLLCFPMGFIPLILFGVVMYIHQRGKEEYEKHLNRLKNNTLGTHDAPKTATGASNELAQLAELHKSGALTDAEFQIAKAAALKKAAA